MSSLSTSDPDRRPASSASAAAEAAPSTTSSESQDRWRNARRPLPVYSSTVTWKLVPPKPNELTDARLGTPLSAIHGVVRVDR